MAILMTGLCEKGVELIWKQCNEELYPQGIEYLEEAAHAGDAEGWFFLGNCYSWGAAPSVSVIKKHTNVTRKA